MNKAVTWLATMAFCVATAAPALAAEDSIKIGVQGAHSGDWPPTACPASTR